MKSDTLNALRRGDLAGTRELSLASCGLTEMPSDVFGLADTLEVLDLCGNHLTELPVDLSRLHRLRVLFCSGNRFERLPPCLGDCAALSQLGFRGTGLREVPGEALPPQLRWLTLTDNRITELPTALGERPRLQKLMLAGNRLRDLPAGLADAERLELVRLAANGIEVLPPWLVTMPALAWLAWAGNPCQRRATVPDILRVPWSDLTGGERLGEGASGRVQAAVWRARGDTTGRPVALKLFKGAMTSDGLPEHEMDACLAAGQHQNLTGALGRLVDHPDGIEGLLMPLVPPDWRVLAGPPSLESCSRDIYNPSLGLDPAVVLRIARGVAAATAHLHARGILHGDLYAHNVLWDGDGGTAVLSDFGAASTLPAGSSGDALARLEVRAFGILLGELLSRALLEPADLAHWRLLERDCTQSNPAARPLMGDVLAAFDSGDLPRENPEPPGF